MRYSMIFIAAALACLLLSEAYGTWMLQAPERFALHPAHTHLSLTGWVTLALYGLIHRAYPDLATARLAPFQCLFAIVGPLIMAPGVFTAIQSSERDVMVATLGSLIIVVGVVMFIIMFMGKVAMARHHRS
jgi:hypothetical protein